MLERSRYVRYWLKADLNERSDNVRFTPENGHSTDLCPLLGVQRTFFGLVISSAFDGGLNRSTQHFILNREMEWL